LKRRFRAACWRPWLTSASIKFEGVVTSPSGRSTSRHHRSTKSARVDASTVARLSGSPRRYAPSRSSGVGPGYPVQPLETLRVGVGPRRVSGRSGGYPAGVSAATPGPWPPEEFLLPRAIRAGLLPEEAGDFDREFRAAMSAATETLDLTGVLDLLERWRRVARSSRDERAHRRQAAAPCTPCGHGTTTARPLTLPSCRSR